MYENYIFITSKSKLYNSQQSFQIIFCQDFLLHYAYYYKFSYHLNSECSKGSYGMNCNESCGSCSNVSHCSHVDGTCQSGCSPGYRHNLCKKGLVFIPHGQLIFIHSFMKKVLRLKIFGFFFFFQILKRCFSMTGNRLLIKLLNQHIFQFVRRVDLDKTVL